jgi:hypothetical protein
MSKHYAEMRETVEWEKSQGVSEYPGMGTFDAAIEIAARKDQSIVAIAEDRVSNVTFTVAPKHRVTVGDRIDGAEIIEVSSVKDHLGKVIRWIAYGKE